MKTFFVILLSVLLSSSAVNAIETFLRDTVGNRLVPGLLYQLESYSYHRLTVASNSLDIILARGGGSPVMFFPASEGKIKRGTRMNILLPHQTAKKWWDVTDSTTRKVVAVENEPTTKMFQIMENTVLGGYYLFYNGSLVRAGKDCYHLDVNDGDGCEKTLLIKFVNAPGHLVWDTDGDELVPGLTYQLMSLFNRSLTVASNSSDIILAKEGGSPVMFSSKGKIEIGTPMNIQFPHQTAKKWWDVTNSKTRKVVAVENEPTTKMFQIKEDTVFGGYYLFYNDYSVVRVSETRKDCYHLNSNDGDAGKLKIKFQKHRA